MLSPRALSCSTTTRVPSTEGPSSSLVSSSARAIRGAGVAARNSSSATMKAAIEVFMSLAPRPSSRPSLRVGENGLLLHCSSGPVGTTSVWPAKTMVLTAVLLASCASGTCATGRLAHRLLTRCRAGPLSMRSQTKPSGASLAASRSRQPASSGAIEGRAMSCSARCRGRVIGQVIGQNIGQEEGSGIGRVIEHDLGECGLVVGHMLACLYLGTAGLVRQREVILQAPHQVGRRVGMGQALLAFYLACHDQCGQCLLEGLRA